MKIFGRESKALYKTLNRRAAEVRPSLGTTRQVPPEADAGFVAFGGVPSRRIVVALKALWRSKSAWLQNVNNPPERFHFWKRWLYKFPLAEKFLNEDESWDLPGFEINASFKGKDFRNNPGLLADLKDVIRCAQEAKQSIDLSQADLRGLDFSGMNLEYINFAGAKLAGANFEEVLFRFCNLKKQDLRKFKLNDAKFDSMCDLRGATMPAKVNFSFPGSRTTPSVDLRDINWQGVDLRGVKIGEAILSGADLSKTDLRGASFTHCDLNDVKLPLDLREVSFYVTPGLENYDFRNSNVEKADLNFYGMKLSNLPLNLQNTNMLSFDLRNLDLSKHDLRGAYVGAYYDPEANSYGFKSTVFPPDLENLKIQCSDYVDLTEKDFSQSNLRGLSLLKLELSPDPAKLPKKLTQWLDPSDLNRVLRFLLNALETEEQYEAYALAVKNIAVDDLKEHFQNLIEAFDKGLLESPGGCLDALEGLYVKADREGHRAFENAVRAINMLSGHPIKMAVQISDKSMRKTAINGLRLIAKMPIETKAFWLEECLKPSARNSTANTLSILECLGPINVLSAILTKQELEELIGQYLTQQVLLHQSEYPPWAIIADNIHKLTESQLAKLLELTALNVNGVPVKNLRAALPKRLFQWVYSKPELNELLQRFITENNLQLSVNSKLKFTLSNLRVIFAEGC